MQKILRRVLIKVVLFVFVINILFVGTPVEAATTIEAENATLGGSLLPQICNSPSGYSGTGFIGYFYLDGQYVSMNVNAAASGLYKISFRYSGVGDSSRTIYVNGNLVTDRLVFIKTCDDWTVWGTASIIVNLNAGTNEIKCKVETQYGNVGYVNLDSLSYEAASIGSAYSSSHNAPCRIESEDFNTGGNGDAYYDTTTGNTGANYRNTDVDISACDEGGYTVSYGENGEWLNYTVNASLTGKYDIKVRTACPFDGAKAQFFINDVDYGIYDIPSTGNYQVYKTFDGPEAVYLPSGPNVIRVKLIAQQGWCINLNWMDIGNFTPIAEAENGTLGGSPLPSICTDYKGYTGTGFIGWFGSEGQYIENNINVPTAGTYKIKYHYSAPVLASRSIYVNGIRVVNNLKFKPTVNWKSWYSVEFIADLNAGNNTIKCKYEGAYGSSNYINIDNVTASWLNNGNKPYGTNIIPGLVECESFDNGGQGISYSDTSSGNIGGQYRVTDVDIANVGTEGNVVGWISGGEWLKYTINVTKTQNYNMVLRVDNPHTGSKVSIFVDEKETGDFVLPVTGTNWGTYANMNGPQKLLLTEGTHEIKIESKYGQDMFNLNWFSLNADFAITPGIYTSTLGSDDVIVYTVKVTDYGAIPNSDNDATSAFQNALDTVEALGGGVVFAPAGKYRINGHLKIGRGVTLRGEWKSPASGGLGQGTILKAYENQGNELGSPFIAMDRSSGLKCIGIWYPNQSFSNVQKYPYTIQGYKTQDVITVSNVTLYNSYNGFQLGQNKTVNGCNTYKDIYGTVLKTGIKQDSCFDVPRFENIYFDTTYWANSGLTGAPASASEQETLKTYTRSNTVGIDTYRSDWQWMYNINLSNMLTGIEFNNGSMGSAICTLSYPNISNVNTGIKINSMGLTGLQLSYGTINASVGTNPTGILCNSSSPVTISGTTIGGTPHTGIKVTGNNCVLNLSNVTFSDWGYGGGTYAVDSQSGAVIIQKCNFQQNKKHIRLSASTTGADILSNTFTGSPQIDNYSSGFIVINHSNISIPVQPVYNYTFAPEKKPANTTNFFNVKNFPYNAAGDGSTDDTSAIQSALTAAGSAGGGTVYLPAGNYRVNTNLVVPTGVELRGSYDVNHHGMVCKGSVIYAFGGKGNANGTPLISLNANSGMRGISIFYPEQNWESPVAYPWAIRGLGDGCWVKYVCFVNAYQGIDMMTYRCNGNVLSCVTGLALNTISKVGKGTTSGWFEDHHWNPTNWLFSDLPGAPGGSYVRDWFDSLEATATGFVFGACSGYNNFQNFSIILNESMKFTNEPEGAYSGTVFNCGFDENKTGVKLQYGNNINFIQLQTVSCFDSAAIVTDSTFTGTANFFNCATWPGSTKNAIINGGTVGLVQHESLDSSSCKVNAGTFYAYGCSFQHVNAPITTNDFEFGSGITSATVIGCMGKGALNTIDNSGGKMVYVYNSIY